jgi:hypothetical protein
VDEDGASIEPPCAGVSTAAEPSGVEENVVKHFGGGRIRVVNMVDREVGIMKNVLTYIKGDQRFVFKYEVGYDEPELMETIVEYIDKGVLDCFDAASIRDLVERALKGFHG